MTELTLNLSAHNPEIFLGILVVILLLYRKRLQAQSNLGLWMLSMSGTGLAIALIPTAIQPSMAGYPVVLDIVGVSWHDRLSYFANYIILCSVIMSLLFNYSFIRNHEKPGKIISLTLLSAIGAITIANASHAASLLTGLILLVGSCSFLMLAESVERVSRESAFKLLFAGLISIGILVLGTGFFLAGTGTLNLHGYTVNTTGEVPFSVGLIMIVVSMMIPAGVLPFSAWKSQTFTGGYNSTGIIAALTFVGPFIALVRLIPQIFIPGLSGWVLTGLMATGLFSALAGNLLMFVQTDFRRLLACSALAWGGYFVVGLVTLKTAAVAGALLGIAVLAPVLLAAFSIANFIPSLRNQNFLIALKGLAVRSPAFAIFFAVILAALSAIPLTAGFIPFLVVLKGIADSGLGYAVLFLVIVHLLGVSVYLRIFSVMFLPDVLETGEAGCSLDEPGHTGGLGMVLTFAFVILLGLAPSPVISQAFMAVEYLGLIR